MTVPHEARGRGKGQTSNSDRSQSCQLKPSDRRLLLASSLWLYFNRARRGIPVHSRELVELAKYADPDESAELPAVAA